MISGFFRGGKKIDPRLRKRKQSKKRLSKCTDGGCGPTVPIILHLDIEGLTKKNLRSQPIRHQI